MPGHLRVLDLTDERGLLCGRLLADLGADVVQVEPAGGSSARAAVPLSGEVSLYWETYAAGKRGVAFDLDDRAGQDAVRRLAAAADVLVTSYPEEWLRERGLDAGTVRAGAPHLVYTAISAFGRSGPKAGYAESDLVVWAAGGPLDPHRDGDRPPLRISVPQAFAHAAADAAAGTLIAVLARRATGRGQVVDVSAQASVAQATLARVLADAVGDANPEWQQQPRKRVDQSGSGAATPNSMKKWRCRDGLIELHLSMGGAAGAFTNNLFAWLRAEGAVDERIASWDWRVVPDLIADGEVEPGDLEDARAAVRAFLLTKTKAEVVAAATEHRLLCMAIYDMADVAAGPHLRARDFWAELEIGGRPVRVPGRIARVDGGEGPVVRGRAPSVGEHTGDVLGEWTARDRPAVPRPGTSGRHGERPRHALEGLKVLDLSWVVAGPLIGRSLADFGARVVRVESGTRVETARMMQPFHGGVPGRENSALFGNCNAGKLGMTIDLKSPEGREIVRDLARWADVVIESFSPGQMAKWGLDYASLSADRPDLVMLSTSIAGQSGPWAALAGFGNVGSSLSGFQNLVGWEDRVPMGPFGPYTDYVGPRLALATLLAALEDRHRTGRGRYIDLAQVEAGVFFLSPQVAHYGYDGTIARRRGNRDEAHAPHGVYPCRPEDGRDRFVAVAARTDAEWRSLAGEIGRADLAAYGLAERRAREDEIDEAIAAWTAGLRAADAEHRLQALGVPAHLSASSADLVADPQLAARGHFVRLDHPLHGTTWVEGPRYLLSDTPGEVVRPAPTLGQHNETVLRDVLGLPATRIRELEEGGVLR
ncbi:CoA transferase [Actinomadura vinacea]|uniref:CoA transferase n=1 Tax=Actinomadura vinacea TaxID=115336 RepID=A0ABN3K7V0_9ACTN